MDTFAADRSHNDADASNDATKAAAQAALILNGGAGSAFLAYLGKGPADTVVLWVAPFSLSLYIVGVFLAALMLDNMATAFYQWAVFWQDVAYGHETESNLKNCPARKTWAFVIVKFRFSLACFVLGSVALASAFLVARYYTKS